MRRLWLLSSGEDPFSSFTNPNNWPKCLCSFILSFIFLNVCETNFVDLYLVTKAIKLIMFTESPRVVQWLEMNFRPVFLHNASWIQFMVLVNHTIAIRKMLKCIYESFQLPKRSTYRAKSLASFLNKKLIVLTWCFSLFVS